VHQGEQVYRFFTRQLAAPRKRGDVSVKVPGQLDWYLAKVWSNHAKLGVTMRDLDTTYSLEDVEQMHMALDVYDDLDRKLAALQAKAAQ
jgi:hypothetical protein